MYFAGDEENFNKDHADGVRRKPGTQDDYTAGIKKPQQDCPCHSGGVLLKWNRIDPDFSGNMETIGKHEHYKDETFKLSLYPSR